MNYSWDLGTCIPPTILGSDGVVTLNQKSITCLSLTTDFSCPEFYKLQYEIDLGQFNQLQRLRWRAPHAENVVGPLSDVIRLNCERLQELELDLVRWSSFSRYLDRKNEGNSRENYFMREILGLKKTPPQPCFMRISTLSLSHVPLGAAMVHTINFDTLTSLTLRHCPEWDAFIECVLDLRISVRLKTLKIQYEHILDGEFGIGAFLVSFQGLEDLAITEFRPRNTTLELLGRVAHHRATLKRFTYHQRQIARSAESIMG